MIDLDEDALICDFAETYHIYDLYQHPCEYVAVLAAGLRSDSRIMVKLSGLRLTPELFTMCDIADSLRILRWWKTKDGQKGRNMPRMLLDVFSGETKKEENEGLRGFRSGEDFLREWKRLTEGAN